jgi:hypothetical protein
MPAHGPTASTGLAQVAPRALADAAERGGLDASGARLIRLYATAVYHLPAANAVARIAVITSSKTVASLETSVHVTRWLATMEFPAVEPLAVAQPISSHGCAVTFWRYLPQDARGPDSSPADLGYLLQRLHEFSPPPITLPIYQPLRRTCEAIQASRAVSDTERAWLTQHCEQLLASYRQLAFELPPGMIHGDAWQGNLLRGHGRVVLADWDQVSTGPREIDLIPTLQAVRFGLPGYQRDAFIAAYGRDIRSWPGYTVLRDIRELWTMTALLRNAHMDPAASHELAVRLRSLRTGDDQQWTTFLRAECQSATTSRRPCASEHGAKRS